VTPSHDAVTPDASADGALFPEAEDYLTWLVVERGRAVSTVAAYRRDLRAYQAYLADRGVASLSAVGPGDVGAYVAALRASGLAAATVARRVVAVRSLHSFMVIEGLAPDDPSVHVEQPRVPAGLPKALDEDEVTALVESPSGDNPADRRDRALLEVLYGTGARISEATGMSLGDVDFETGTIRLLGKGSRERVVPLGGAAARALGEWLGPGGRDAMMPEQWAHRHAEQAVFINRRGGRLSRQGAWNIVRNRARQAGITAHLSPHVLRHSCATHMLNHGADVRAVQELLGHASIGTTQVYTRVSAAHLRRAFEQAHPRARRAR
jgi:integrase/recombinase XerD